MPSIKRFPEEDEALETVMANEKVKKDKKEKKDKKSDKKEKKEKKDKKKVDDIDNMDNEKSSKTKSKRSKSSDASDESSPTPSPKKRKTSKTTESPVTLSNGLEESSSQTSDDLLLLQVPENLRFTSYRLSEATIASLKSRGINSLFPIQAATFDHIFDGKDLLGRARTGTGKTLAFALPMTERLLREGIDKGKRAPRVIVLTPTRDLARQVAAEFSWISPALQCLCIYGGVPYDSQTTSLYRGVDVVIGTPGRVQDHINRGNLVLDSLRFVCLDEADQMLDIGFAEDMERVLQAVQEQKKNNGGGEYQTLLFSATVPDWVKETVRKYLKKGYANVDLVGNEKVKTNENIHHYAIPSTWQSRKDVIGDVVAVYGASDGLTVIFTNTKAEANELALNDKLKQDAQVLHGDIPQATREITLKGFREGKFKCIICTDVLARGLDIPEVDLVVNCQPPKDVETYIHRSGRTGRAGRRGACVTFYKPQEEFIIQKIQRQTGSTIAIVGPPQPEDIIRATASDAISSVEQVDKDVLQLFTTFSSELIKGRFAGDATAALSAALACIAGYANGLKNRSLLSSTEGYTTLLFRIPYTIQHPGYIRSILNRQFSQIQYEDIKGMRMTKDMKGVVCDCVSEKVAIDDEGCVSLSGVKWNDRNITLEVAKVLPELQEKDNSNDNYNTRNGRYNQRNNGGGQGNWNANTRFNGNNNNGRIMRSYDNGQSRRSYGNGTYRGHGGRR